MQNDFIIVLAWPEGLVSGAGSWYDKIFSSNGKYRVGHSALILVNSNSGQLHYFDFGRYETPIGFGRVRDQTTDPQLVLNTNAVIKNSNIKNINSILLEVSKIKITNGEGKMYASILSNISFKEGYKYAKSMQKKGMVDYGPLVIGGTNCSRFVSSLMISAKPALYVKLRLRFPVCISASPKRNISIANTNYYVINNMIFYEVYKSFFKSYFTSIERL